MEEPTCEPRSVTCALNHWPALVTQPQDHPSPLTGQEQPVSMYVPEALASPENQTLRIIVRRPQGSQNPGRL